MDVSPPPEGPSGDTNPSRSEASLSRPRSHWVTVMLIWTSWVLVFLRHACKTHTRLLEAADTM